MKVLVAVIVGLACVGLALCGLIPAIVPGAVLLVWAAQQ